MFRKLACLTSLMLLASVLGCAGRGVTEDSGQHPALLGQIGDTSWLGRLDERLDHEPLLAAAELRAKLGASLTSGLITGYDVRAKDIYDGFPGGRTLIYSHESPEHLRQLVEVLDREGVAGTVYLTPKVSAFLYRDEWGSAGDNVVSLASGERVVQGREMAVLFEFPDRDGLQRFHQVVNRYAKRDSDDETGLIVDSWWQPFYYADEVVEGFEAISLVVVSAEEVEATLTVVEAKAGEVMAAFAGGSLAVREDKVWVNPAFFRFLEGGYK